MREEKGKGLRGKEGRRDEEAERGDGGEERDESCR